MASTNRRWVVVHARREVRFDSWTPVKGYEQILVILPMIRVGRLKKNRRSMRSNLLISDVMR
jgi:hypothetical protein